MQLTQFHSTVKQPNSAGSGTTAALALNLHSYLLSPVTIGAALRTDSIKRHGMSFRLKACEETSMTENKKWVQGVKSVSTYPPKNLFTMDARTIARQHLSRTL